MDGAMSEVRCSKTRLARLEEQGPSRVHPEVGSTVVVLVQAESQSKIQRSKDGNSNRLKLVRACELKPVRAHKAPHLDFF